MIRCARVVSICLMLSSTAWALAPASSEFYGARRGAFLGQGVGARAVGMGEAFTALADDATAGFWNPGGLGRLSSFHAAAMYDAAGEGIGLSYLAAALPLGPGVAGGSLTLLSFGDTIKRDANGVKLGTQGLTDFSFSGSYGMAHPAAFGIPGSSGISLEVVSESAGGALFGASIGSVVPFPNGLTLGWAAQHLSPPSDGFTLPAALKVGAAYDLPALLTLAADVGIGLADQGMWIATGAEVRPMPLFAVRAGYKWRGADLGFAGLAGLTAGLGARLAGFSLDYAFQPYGDLATSHRISLSYGMPATVGSSADRILKEATAAYSGGEYAEALRLAEESLATRPDHAKTWQLLGNIKYATKDRPGALGAWKRSLELNPDNSRLRDFVAEAEKPPKKAPANGKPARKKPAAGNPAPAQP